MESSGSTYLEEVTFVLRPDQLKGASHGKMREEHPGQRDSKCKGPGVDTGLACSRKSKEWSHLGENARGQDETGRWGVRHARI